MTAPQLRAGAVFRHAFPPGVVAKARAGRVQTSATVPPADYWLFGGAVLMHPLTLAQLLQVELEPDQDFPRDCPPG